MAYTVKNFEQILSDWVAWMVANSSKITDLSPGSVIRSFCEAGSLAIEEVYIATYLGFQRHLDNIPEGVFGFRKKTGVKAFAEVTFSRPGTSGEIVIPAGIRVQTASGLRFLVENEGRLGDTKKDSGPIRVLAEEIGTTYNVPSGAINVLEDPIEGIETVTNKHASRGGVDLESDLAFRGRFQSYIEGLGRSNPAGLTSGALSVEGITSVSLVEHFPAEKNFHVTLYVDDGSSIGISAEKLNEVRSVIDGDGTQANPGYRSAGINVAVEGPTIQTQPVAMSVKAVTGLDLSNLENDILKSVTSYINTLGVGEDIIYNEIVSSIMGVYGVIDCDVSVPSKNVSVVKSQVGRTGDISITWV